MEKDWWSYILRPEGTDALGELLAQHPDAVKNTARLTTGLSVLKLIRIANAEYHYCRLGRDIPATGDVAKRSAAAWRILDSKTRSLQMRDGTAWMRTVELLAAGSDVGLGTTRQLSIDRFIVVCERLIKGPYREMTKSKVLQRW